MANMFAFNWEVNKSGYEIVEAPIKLKPGEKDGGEIGRFIVRTSPIKERNYKLHMVGPGVFQAFAEVEPTETGALEFARKYGMLSDSRFSQTVISDPKLPYSHRQGELVSVWQREIKEISRITTLWNRTNAGDVEWLAKRIVRPPSTNLISYAEPVGGVNPFRVATTLNSVTVGEVEPLEPGDLIKPARALVARMVDRHLGQSASPRLLFVREGRGQGSAPMRLIPNDLLGALWLQFAQAVAQDDRYFVCEVCGSWFVAKRMQGSKPMRHYCPGSACKSKAQRQRKTAQAATAELPQSR